MLEEKYLFSLTIDKLACDSLVCTYEFKWVVSLK